MNNTLRHALVALAFTLPLASVVFAQVADAYVPAYANRGRVDAEPKPEKAALAFRGLLPA